MSVVAEPPILDPVRVKEVSEAYMSSLTDLTVNSKPLITMLTMLADENIEYAAVIVDTIEKHIIEVRAEHKLPILYLIDSIVKNLQSYRRHVNIKIVNIFCDVFSKVNETVREKMFQLRQTWNDVFPQTKLYTLDVKVNHIDPNWPITAQFQPKSPAIHVNPYFFKMNKATTATQLTDELKKKQIELIELERKKQELERTVSKKTQNVQNQHKKIPQMARAPVVGAPMPPVASLPKIPKVQQQNSASRKDPRINRGNNINASRAVSNGDGGGTSNSINKKKRTDKPKSDSVSRKRSSDERHSSKSGKSSSSNVTKSNSESSTASTTSPNKRTDRKRPRSPPPGKTLHPKRSRERSPETLHEQSKRDKKSGSSSSHGSNRSSDKIKSKASSPKTLQQTGDVDLRVPIKTNDVDLRQMSVVDITDDDDDMTSRKSSTRIDNLFGNQDLDLRTLIKPPSAPLISTKSGSNKNISKLDQVRAKLAADMSKQKDNLGRPLLYKQNNDPRKRQNSMETIVIDDLNIPKIRDEMTEDLNNSLTLIVNQAHEQLATKRINPEQYKKLMQDVFHIKENNKIQQAKRRDSQRVMRGSPITIVDTPKYNNENNDIAVDRLIAMDQVNAPPPAILTTIVPGASWQANQTMHQPPPSLSTTGIQPVTTVQDTSVDDVVRTINIDGMPRDIRFYNETAVVFMEEPREIGFENGERRLTVDGIEAAILHFNHAYKPIMIQGQLHHVRLGAPTRELYLDNMPYECYIGGPALPILIDGVIRMIGVDGPEPKVKIGEERKDLVLGKIHMIIDGTIVVSIFLDSKLQTFELPDTGHHTLQIADYLQTILIDGLPIQNVEYGGLPKSFDIGNKKRFIRFTTLPKGVSKGKPLNNIKLNKPSSLANLLPSTSVADTPIVPINSTQVPAVTSTQDVSQPNSQVSAVPVMATVAPGINLNIEELFQRLITSGIINGDKKADKPDEPAEQKKEQIHKIDLNQPKTIKKRSAGIVDTLYNGMQCSSCGVRFPPEQTMKYSQHLDWHFRQNRRDRDASKRAHSRKWYYDVSDWIQFEEIEDLEEREKNWFEKHGTQADFDIEEMEKSPKDQMVSCQAGPKGAEETCDVCQDKFEYFFNEENEEWHLKNAVRVEDKCYHPMCYDDHKAALARDKLAEEKALEMDTSNPNESSTEETFDKGEPMEQDELIKTEQKETEESAQEKMDETEDDDVIVLPPQNPTITEILDDDDDERGYKINEIEDTTVDSPKVENSNKEKSKSPISVEEYNPTDMNEIKVKQEPIDDLVDNDDDAFEDVGTMEVSVLEEENTLDSPAVPVIDDESSNLSSRDINEASNDALAEQSNSNNSVSYDRNLSMNQTYGPAQAVNRIIVNITKPIGARSPKDTETPVASPGHVAQEDEYYEQMSEEEPEPEFEVKSQLKDVQFKKLPPAEVGYETSGLCSIM